MSCSVELSMKKFYNLEAWPPDEREKFCISQPKHMWQFTKIWYIHTYCICIKSFLHANNFSLSLQGLGVYPYQQRFIMH